MMVLGNVGKISWKVTIPIIIFCVVTGVGIWFFPVHGYYLSQRVFGYFLNIACSLSALILIVGTLAWTIGGDNPSNEKEEE